MTQEEIKDMMLYGERINVEYKEAFNELPKSFGKPTPRSPIQLADR